MTEIIAKGHSAAGVAETALPETLRQQYLSAMGIQVWYDPSCLASLPATPDYSAQAVATASSVVHTDKLNAKAEPSPGTLSAKPESLQTPALSVSHQSDIVGEPQTPSTLSALNATMQQCTLCELHVSRQHVACGEGAESAQLMIISDAPVTDAAEDALFKADEKRMLQAMLKSIGQDINTVYLTSLVKCRPPEQRAPFTSEMICCDDHLSQQIQLIQPAAIMILGEQASRQLLVSQKPLSDLRLRHHQHLDVPVYASYHPRDLFNSAETKRKVWQDLLQVKYQLSKS